MIETNNVFKERFEYIIGFVALTISIGEFKDELANITITVPHLSFNLSQYFIAIILAALVALHFYFLPLFIRGEGKTRSKLKNLFTAISHAILLFIVLSPFLIGAAWLATIIKLPRIYINPKIKDALTIIYSAFLIGVTLYNIIKAVTYSSKSRTEWRDRQEYELKRIGEGMTLDEYIRYRYDEMVNHWTKLYNEKKNIYHEQKQKELEQEAQMNLQKESPN